VTTASAVLIVDDVEYQPHGKELRCVRCGAPIGDNGTSLGLLVVDGRTHSAKHHEPPRDLLGELAGERRSTPFPPSATVPAPFVIRTVVDHDPEGAAVL
jgi:hypothetical protein